MREFCYEERAGGRCREQRVSCVRSGTRDLSANPVLHGKDDQFIFSNRVDNPIIALANPIEVGQAFKYRDAGGTRTGAESMEPFYEKLPKRFGECMELLLSGRGHKNCRECLVQSEPQFF